ncbi:globin [bacterium (Candidatus Blackallbacteria) CG17_big_fil_post_rev_8_21_14_2_50_48_46]|uniref:Globin n=1 Tax=bacterium (Candidatus Blackallbacteria) CG17_big_fil_post_rev_8_21_14_2_50_48_46 TaxID=2014261 RepID=A0A2M7G072_9BACT|nr:MAG: globin [bacterium (Candidatus Blackallbacteria) CG18_big_fil_WC_8_21_14_2_50_49_26]PIW14984.1 MAG: globin [bacterium (Candidatus Blackallbacteria) CG17_big_fil_post_rev_8_21_14_2_50_48_46]PIW50065.1 MAG: globin [bacterium (Candidatus Blackallbacteria) CG13_big_fil_rev_8_21_14_2_50_49_14]
MKDSDFVKLSFGRCLNQTDIIGRFYQIFLDSHPDIRPMFANTNFEVQKGLLRQGINLALMFADDNPVGKSGLARIRESHGKKNLNIRPELYSYWKRSFMQAISECDNEYSPEIRAHWDRILQKAIDYIISGYDEQA